MGETPDPLAGRAFEPDKPDANQLVNLDNEADQAVLHRDRIRAAATAATAETLRAPRRGWKASLAAILADLRAILRIPGQIRLANDRGFPAIGIRNEDLATEATAEGRFVFLATDRFGRLQVSGNRTPSDAMANPTRAIDVAGFQAHWNGATWDRAPGNTAAAYTVKRRPSSRTGVTAIHRNVSNQTTDQTLYTVTAGKTFYLTNILLGSINTSTSSEGVMVIRDGAGGTIQIPYLMGQAGLGSIAASQAIAAAPMAFEEPIPFTTAVVADIVAGTVRYSCMIVGYEE